MPDYDGGGLVNLPATVLDVLGARVATDAPALAGLDPALGEGVRQVVVILTESDSLRGEERKRFVKDKLEALQQDVLARRHA